MTDQVEANGSNYITMETLRPLLEQLKQEIVQEVSAKLSSDVTAVLMRQVKDDIQPLYDDWEATQKRLAEHSNSINEHTQKLVAQAAHDKRVMDMIEAGSKRFEESNQRYDKIGDDLKSVISSLSQTEKMIDFVHRNVGENKADIVRNENRFEEYKQLQEQEDRDQESRYHELRDLVTGALTSQNETAKDLSKIKGQLENQEPVITTLTAIRTTFHKHGGKILSLASAIITVIVLPNLVTIGEFVARLLKLG